MRFARPYVRPRVFVGGSIWLGGYYYPRPYYYYYYPSYVPSYYGGAYGSYYSDSYNGSYNGSYYPVQPPASQAVVAAPAPRRPMPTFGIGVSAGGTAVEDQRESSDLSALVRFRLTPGLLIEGELGKTEFDNNVRVDRRLGGSMIWEIGAHNSFAPYLLGGLGVQQADVGDSFSTRQQFGEVGVGLRLALGRNLHLTADIRGGRRPASDSAEELVAARAVLAPVPEESEDYTRARLAAFLYF